MLEICVKLSLEATGADSCTLFIDEDGADELRAAVHWHAPGAEAAVFASLPRRFIERYRGGDAQATIRLCEDSTEPYRTACLAAGLAEAVTVPLFAEREPIGLLTLGFRSRQSLSPTTLNTLVALGAEQAVAIDRARTHALAEQRALLADVLREVGRRALAATSGEETFTAILDGLAEITGTPSARLSLVGDDGTLRTLSSRALPSELAAFPPIPESEASVRWASTLDAVFEVRSADGLPPDSIHRRLFEEAHLSSLLILPLRSRGRFFGVLASPSQELRRFDCEQVGSFALLASLAAAAVEGERLRRRAEENGAMLRELAEAKDRFLGIASHELRSPDRLAHAPASSC